MIPYYKYKQAPMNNEQSRLFMALFLMDDPAKIEDMMADVMQLPLGAALVKRTQALNIPVAAATYLFLTATCLNSMGEMSLFTHALYCIHKERQQEVTLSLLAEYFSCGFPDEEECDKAWVAQKLPTGDNEVDDMSNYV